MNANVLTSPTFPKYIPPTSQLVSSVREVLVSSRQYLNQTQVKEGLSPPSFVPRHNPSNLYKKAHR